LYYCIWNTMRENTVEKSRRELSNIICRLTVEVKMNRDADGFLINSNDWSTDIMKQMALEDGFEITDEILTYIMKAREMFNETGTVPAVRVFAKEFGMDRKAKGLYDVFESGPMKKIAKYGGLPKPTGCV